MKCMLCVSVPDDLSLEERDELSNIRRRKKELLDDIEVCFRYDRCNVLHAQNTVSPKPVAGLTSF